MWWSELWCSFHLFFQYLKKTEEVRNEWDVSWPTRLADRELQKLSAGRKTAIRKVARALNQRGVFPMRLTHARESKAVERSVEAKAAGVTKGDYYTNALTSTSRAIMADFANTGQRRFPYKSLETKLLVYTSAKLTSPTPDIHRSF